MIAEDFAPTVVEINSLGIGLLNYSNIDDLDLNPGEFLVVGEQYNTSNTSIDKKYSLIVNRDGVAINTTRRRFDAVNDGAVKSSGLYVNNNIICDGNIIANGLKLANVTLSEEINSNMLNDLIKNINATNPLFYSGYTSLKNETDTLNTQLLSVDNIYTPSYITIGGIIDTYNNTNPLNIVSTTNNNINNVHISIRNNINNDSDEPASVRMGIVGDTASSPAIITTTTGMPLEFHVGIKSDDLNILYNDKTGIPDYSSNKNLIPSIVIDTDGNVGFGDTTTDTISYTKYFKDSDAKITKQVVTKPSKVKVSGSAYIDDIITYDYYSKSNLHLDDIYIRKVGLNFEANQIIPGDFNSGIFNFNSNLYIGHTGDEYTLEVNNYLDVKGNLNVDNDTILKNMYVDNATFYNDTSFNNDVHINKDVILGRNLAINYGDLFLGNERINISELHPIMVDATIANSSNINGSNILFYASSDTLNISGSNLAVPGRLGAGILNSDEYNEQFNIIKRNPKQFEILIQDSSEENVKTHIPMVYMGHLKGLKDVNYINDSSFIINTNKLDDIHNIYFYTGVDIDRTNFKDVVPTLTIHQNNRIGINNNKPLYSLDVNGDILCNDLYINIYNKPHKTLLFSYLKDETSLPNDNSRDIYYLYDEKGANKFCINFADKTGIDTKGLNVKGGIHAVTDGFYENNVKVETLKNIDSSEKYAYTNKNISIGWDKRYDSSNLTKKPLNIRNTSLSDYNDSIIRFYRGKRVGGERNSAKFSGIDICEYEVPQIIGDKNLYKWFMYKNHEYDNSFTNVGPLQFGYTNGTEHPTNYGMTMYYNKQKSIYHIDINNPNINNNLQNRKSTMSIYGDLDVHGNINIIDLNNSNFNYKINGITSSTTAIQELNAANNPTNPTDPNNTNGEILNDVVITAKKIALIPNKTVAIGHLDNSFTNYIGHLGQPGNDYNTPLLVYQNDTEQSICKFNAADISGKEYNKASIEIGILNTVDNNYSGIKKNTVELSVSSYNNKDKENNTLFELKSYNPLYSHSRKLMSFYNNNYSTYVNIGNKQFSHNQSNGDLFIGDITNVGLHIENNSKYLLQLTNDVLPPTINMHRRSNDRNDFWIIEAPDNDGNFNIKNSYSNNSYIPDAMNNIFTITPTNMIGINNSDPTFSLDVKSTDNTSTMRIINKYNDEFVYNNYSAIKIVNSNLYYTEIDTPYSFVSNTYYSGIKYNFNTSHYNASNYPDRDIIGNSILYDFFISSNFVKNTFIPYEKEYIINKDYDITIASNFGYLQNYFVNSNRPLVINNIIDNTGNFNINLTKINNFVPPLPTDTNLLSYKYDNTHISSNYSFLTNIVNLSSYGLPPGSLRYNYNISNILLSSNYYYANIEQPIVSVIFEGGYTHRINTSNIINNYLSPDNINASYLIFDTVDVVIEDTTFNSVSGFKYYKNYITTSNIYHYNTNDVTNFDFIANIKRTYKYYTEIEGPYSIISSNLNNYSNVTIIGSNINIINDMDFLNPVPYGLYDGFSFESNILSRELHNSKYIDSFNIFGYNFDLIVNLSDRYRIYDFSMLNDLRNLYLVVSSINYLPHITLQNNIDFNNTGEKQYGFVNKIYSKNGDIEFVVENENYKKKLLNLEKNGDVHFDNIVYTKDLVILGDIYDRLGNSMILDYSQSMYEKAFIMQTSNYILQTSNYNISSTSNISFILEGKNTEGFSIRKNDIYNVDNSLNTHDLFKIYEAENTAFSIIHGGKVGIKKDVPMYELDINGDMYASNIITEYIDGDGSKLRKVNLNDRNTSLLNEGSNLYYTDYRVSLITIASNIETSNYIYNETSNINNRITTTSNEISSNLSITSNEISNRLTNTSNTISSNLSNTFNTIINNLNNTSNEISSNLSITSNDISNRLTNTSNTISSNLSNTFNTIINNLNNTSNEISSNLAILSNEISSNLSNTSNTIINKLTNTSNELSSNLINTSNDINRDLKIIEENIIITSNILSTDTSNYIKSLSTNNIVEGSLNKYYKESYFDSSLFSRNLDFISNGTSNRYIKNGIYDGSVEFLGDLKVNNITIFGNTTTTTVQDSVATNILIDGDTPNASLKINKPNTSSDIVSINNYFGSTINSNILEITGNGKVGIGIYPLNSPYKFTIDGSLYATTLYGDGYNITNLNLSQTNTSALPENPTGLTNLYYTPLRAGLLIDGSNIYTSNYIRNTSNNISNRISDISFNLNGALISSSNAISDRVTKLSTTNVAEGTNLYYTDTRVGALCSSSNVNTSNYIRNSSNVISDRVTNLSTTNVAEGTNLYYTDTRVGAVCAGSNVFTSNYITNTSNKLMYEIILSSSNQSNYINSLISEQSTSVIYSMQSTITNNDVNMSNYMKETSNYAVNSSNTISNRITRLSTTNIVEGNNLYYTDIRADVRAGIVSTASNVISAFNLTDSSNAISNRITKLLTESITISGAVNISSSSAPVTINSSDFRTDRQNIITALNDKPALRIENNGNNCNLWIKGVAANAVFVIDNNGNLGIGKTIPTKSLDIDGSFGISGSINNVTSNELAYVGGVISPIQTQITNSSNTISNRVTKLLTESITISGVVNISSSSAPVTINSSDFRTDRQNIITALNDKPALRIENNGNNCNLWIKGVAANAVFVIDNNGNLGIGKTIPQSRLDIDGDIIISPGSKYKSGTSNLSLSDLGGSLLVNQLPAYTGGDVISTAGSASLTLVNSGVVANTYGSATAVPQITVDIKGRVTTCTNIAIVSSQWTTGTNLIYFNNNVGIGTTAPEFKLDVSGDIRISSGSKYKIGANNLAFSDLGGSVAVGQLPAFTGDATSIAGTSALTLATVSVDKGGTGVTTLAANSILYGNGTGAVQTSANLTFDDTALYINGDVTAVGDVISGYSDIRLKNIIGDIENPLDIVKGLKGFKYRGNDVAINNGLSDKNINLGLSAQDVQKYLPEIVKIAPFDSIIGSNNIVESKSGNNYLTLSYEKLVPLLIEAIKELDEKVNRLTKTKK